MGCIWIYTKEIYYEELAQTIMEAENSHDLPSANQKLRNAGSVVPVQTRGYYVQRWMFPYKKREWICPSSDFLLYSLHRLDDAPLHWRGQIIFISLLIQMLISSGNTHTDTSRNKDLSPVKLTHKFYHHSSQGAQDSVKVREIQGWYNKLSDGSEHREQAQKHSGLPRGGLTNLNLKAR